MGDGEAGVPEDEAFDGDAATGATPSGVAPRGNDAMADDDDRAGELSPDEQGR